MPCYTPEVFVSKQEWLLRMMFKALYYLPIDKAMTIFLEEKFQIPADVGDYKKIQKVLCKICRELSCEEIISINGIDIYQGLHEWYRSHLLEDFLHGDEAERALVMGQAEKIDCEIHKRDGQYCIQFGFFKEYSFG